MATSRAEQTHIKRVERIAEEAAAKIAAASPFAEDVIVTIEEVPPAEEVAPTIARQVTDQAASAEQSLVGSRLVPTRYIETLGALSAANTAFVQGIVGAQLRFAGRLAGSVSPRTR
jgi:hypothetical protein